MGVMWPKTLCVLNPPPGDGGGSQQDRHKGVASVWDLLIPVSLRSHSWGLSMVLLHPRESTGSGDLSWPPLSPQGSKGEDMCLIGL